jgi:formylglycine-generating enzyme required for sulfatase activity
LGATEVTQGQWEALMGSTVRQQRDKENSKWPLRGEGSEFPMYYVSWEEAMAYGRKLTERERAAGRLPEGYEYTLPTEAQWEYACRAGTTGPYAGDLAAMGWYDGNSGKTTHAVGQKRPNAWGLYDMHGNVSEWCHDWYNRYPASSVTDPANASSGSARVHRGGSWSDTAARARSAYHFGYPPGYRVTHLGFRVALSAVR